MSVSFYIDCWGPYWRQILSPDWIDSIVRNCGGAFDQISICRNNIPAKDDEEFTRLSNYLMDSGNIDWVLHVDHWTDGMLAKYGVKKSDFDLAPYQSLADLCAIDDCKTEYVVFFSGDSCMWGRSNWVSEGIDLLKKIPSIMIVNPSWNGFFDYEKKMSYAENEQVVLSHGFSDQCYLARIKDLARPIYGETNAQADQIFPKQHGNTFEKRVSAYMHNHRKFRATLKNACYLTRP